MDSLLLINICFFLITLTLLVVNIIVLKKTVKANKAREELFIEQLKIIRALAVSRRRF